MTSVEMFRSSEDGSKCVPNFLENEVPLVEEVEEEKIVFVTVIKYFRN